MTKSTGVGRGVGGGRPRKEATSAKIAGAIGKIVDVGSRTVDLPRLAIKAYVMLENVIDDATLPAAPRVTAARAIIAIDRASRVERAEREFETVEPLGKKAAAAADAAMVISDQDSEWSGLLNPNKPN